MFVSMLYAALLGAREYTHASGDVDASAVALVTVIDDDGDCD